MYTDSEGIVLRRVKAANGRNIILLFSRKYGKVSAGTNLSEKGRSKASLALRPFTLGKYELFKNREYFNINSAEAVRSFYGIGEDIDRYMAASYALEFTTKLLPEEQPEPAVFDLLTEFLGMLEERKSKFDTIVSAYVLKAMAISGSAPCVTECAVCGKKEDLSAFSVKNGGALCTECKKNTKNNCDDASDSLLFDVDFGILEIVNYFIKNPISRLEKIGLDDEKERIVSEIVKSYAAYHLDIDNFRIDNIKY